MALGSTLCLCLLQPTCRGAHLLHSMLHCVCPPAHCCSPRLRRPVRLLRNGQRSALCAMLHALCCSLGPRHCCMLSLWRH